MPHVLTTANCVVSEAAPYICTQCGKKYRGPNTIATCLWGSQPWQAVRTSTAKSRKHRPRTDEEYVAVTRICQACEHFTGELCEIKKSGCRACQSAAKFAQWKMSGAPCPAKPPRFDGTPLVE